MSHAAAPLAQRLTDLCMRLCAIPSVTGDEAALADALWAWASALPEGIARRRFGHSLVLGAPVPGRPTVALVGHIDTVPPSEAAMLPPTCDGVRLTGLGASDMKGGVAVMQAILEDLGGRAQAPITPMLVLYDREEGPYADNGLEPLLAAHPELGEVDLAIAMEPTDNTLQLGCVGSIQATLAFRGKAAHSARPWQGENAIHKAGPLLAQLLRRGAEEVEVDGLIFRQAASVTLAQGGRARNVVPDSFTLNLNYRFAPQVDAMARAQAEVARLAEGCELTITDAAPHGPVPMDNPLVQHFAALCGLGFAPKQAWTDVARLAAHGIDAINYGPGATAQAHQDGEWIEVAAMVRSYEALQRLFTAPLG